MTRQMLAILVLIGLGLPFRALASSQSVEYSTTKDGDLECSAAFLCSRHRPGHNNNKIDIDPIQRGSSEQSSSFWTKSIERCSKDIDGWDYAFKKIRCHLTCHLLNGFCQPWAEAGELARSFSIIAARLQQAHTTRGYLYNASGLYDDAVPDFVQSITLLSGEPFAHYGLGVARMQKGNVAAVITEFQAVSIISSEFRTQIATRLAEAKQQQTAHEEHVDSIAAKPVRPVAPAEGDATGRRVALVIGNSGYASGPLKNPRNDAELMARTLASDGFEVTKVIDADQHTMKKAMLNFGKKLRDCEAEAGLFYYAGHGIQVAGENYLIPVDAEITGEGEVAVEAVNVNDFLGVMEGRRRRSISLSSTPVATIPLSVHSARRAADWPCSARRPRGRSSLPS